MYIDTGEERLRALGYKQELKRDFTLLSNAAISFSIISTLLGVTGSLGIALSNGGAPTAVYAWILVACMTFIVGLAMAEIVSSLPASGGPYFWAVHLSPKRGRLPAFAGWMTGWFNLLGQVAVTSGIDFIFANHLAGMCALSTGIYLTQPQLLATYGTVLCMHGLVNTMPTRVLAWVSTFSAGWHVVGSLFLAVLLPAVAPKHQSARFVFTDFQGVGHTNSGLPNNLYIFLVGTLAAQSNFTGFDACGHMSEETTAADKHAPWGIVTALLTSSVMGLIYILALMFSIQDPAALFTGNAHGNANGYVAGQIYFDLFYARFGSGTGAVAALCIPLVAAFCCGALSVASNSRMLWSFSRDGGVPGHRLWSSVSPLTGTPVNSVWAMVTFAFLLGLPMLYSSVAFTAVVSISTVGLYISYGIPILIRLLNAKDFVPGPFSLGRRAGRVIATLAVCWVAVITVIFMIPSVYPVTYQTLNYAPVAVGTVLVATLVSWFLPWGLGARSWFRGELHSVPLDDVAGEGKLLPKAAWSSA